MRTSFSTSTGLCQVATHEMSSSQWGHMKTGRNEAKLRERSCECKKRLPEGMHCNGEMFVPYARQQKYRPECAQKVHEHKYGSGSWQKEERRRVAKLKQQTRSVSSKHARNLQHEQRLERREKQYLCQTCYNLPHAECRGTVLAVSIERPRTPTKFGCPECGQANHAETVYRPNAMVSNAALAMGV